jgi:hypothetical protein
VTVKNGKWLCPPPTQEFRHGDLLGGDHGAWSRRDERRQSRATRISAARRSWGPSWRIQSSVAEESEDPWLCGPGFRQVCHCRWVERRSYGSVLEMSIERGATGTLPASVPSDSRSSEGCFTVRATATCPCTPTRAPQPIWSSGSTRTWAMFDTAPRSSSTGSSSTSTGWVIGCSGLDFEGRLTLGRTLSGGVRRARQTPTARKCHRGKSFQRAGDRTRTGDVQLGKLAFYH